MAIAHVQGTSNYGVSGSGLSVTLSGVGAGNCLVLSATLHEFSLLSVRVRLLCRIAWEISGSEYASLPLLRRHQARRIGVCMCG